MVAISGSDHKNPTFSWVLHECWVLGSCSVVSLECIGIRTARRRSIPILTCGLWLLDRLLSRKSRTRDKDRGFFI